MFHMMVPLHIRHSFNPYRVFKFVATLNGGDWHLLEDMVSIPIGFSSSLQLKGWVLSSSRSTGFNPYRVFKFVATPGLGSTESRPRCVSIPIGFSSSLQRCDFLDRRGFLALFQSLSGFQVRCNAAYRLASNTSPL